MNSNFLCLLVRNHFSFPSLLIYYIDLCCLFFRLASNHFYLAILYSVNFVNYVSLQKLCRRHHLWVDLSHINVVFAGSDFCNYSFMTGTMHEAGYVNPGIHNHTPSFIFIDSLFHILLCVLSRANIYRQTCIKRSPLGQRKKSDLLRQVTFLKRFNSYEMFYEGTRKLDLLTHVTLIEVTT